MSHNLIQVNLFVFKYSLEYYLFEIIIISNYLIMVECKKTLFFQEHLYHFMLILIVLYIFKK